ncbi:T-cell surface glycoprotein CD1b-3-like isoform X2 [Erpetoichthys calabaricus]|uniref:T-cell surface glycoprotein CD1b-3-like isoform X2 n=1 Tax=Erpetoichthys calabaricus TaxID=27687 RepID=UPI00109F28D7|nr:T-cell surface glycoprotein CD1b-3-like isoform X2 [Erpetoichthys calabaricus]
MFWFRVFGIAYGFHVSCAVTLSFRSVYTTGLNSSDFPIFILEEFIDDIEIYYYNSNTTIWIRQYEWLKNVESPSFLSTQKEISDYLLNASATNIKPLMNILNQISVGYDGEDLIILNMTTLECIIAQEQASLLLHNCVISKVFVQIFQTLCSGWLSEFVFYGGETLNRQVQPSVFLLQKTIPELLETEVTCFVTGFYPQLIDVEWVRDGGQAVQALSGDVLLNDDNTYQVRKVLNVSFMDAEKYGYSCQVNHSSLPRKLIVPWNYKGSSTGIIVGVVVAAVVIIAIIITGLVYWMKRQRGLTNGGGNRVSYVRDLT